MDGFALGAGPGGIQTELSRRGFLRVTGSVVGVVGSVGQQRPRVSGSLQRVSLDLNEDSLRAVFLDPPATARPMTRWWWFGGAITHDEITRELTLMRDAGLGGVELQPVYPLAVDDPQRGILNTPYFSDRWFDLVRHTARETTRLGLLFDFTLGSGWPYGGPMIPLELSARRLRVLRQDIEGPRRCSFEFVAGELTEGDNVLCIVAAPELSSGEPDLSMSKVIARGQRAAQMAFLRSGWNAPAGKWTVTLFIDSPTLMQVKRPTIGMEGYVLDHFDAKAVSLFLHAVADRTLHELKTVTPNPIRSVFCDSLEVYGADWTSAMLSEFERRRGYDLAPYLPALWQNAGPLTPHVRYDYHLTLSDLILDNFFRPLVSWAEAHGTTVRIQAHGAMGDVMRGYGLAHIPEGENYGRSDRYFVNLKHRRIASSAGHVYGRPVISSETFTWLRERLFLVTLEMMKGATDAAFLDGINQIVNHGYPSSPPGAGVPGWTFYAPTLVNHNNTWWRHYIHLARYTRRSAALLRQGRAVNPIAVYLPMADIYAKSGCGSLNVDEAIESHLGLDLFHELRFAGYDFDVINDHALTEIAKVEGGVLRAGTAEYRVVIVLRCRLMTPESLGRITEFAQNGGSVIFIAQLPDMAPGVVEQETRTMRLKSLLADVFGGSTVLPDRARAAGDGKVVLASDRDTALRHLNDFLEPDFTILDAGQKNEAELQCAREGTGFVHRRTKQCDLYFVSNISDAKRYLRVRFACGHKTPEVWSAETGEIRKILAYEHVTTGGRDATEIDLDLEPFQSSFVAFRTGGGGPLISRTNVRLLRLERTSEANILVGEVSASGQYFVTFSSGKTKRFAVSDVPDAVRLEGAWNLRIRDVSIELDRLRSWTELRDAEQYSGWGTYKTTFEMGSLCDDITWSIDLGTVHETAEVQLNGVALGAAWKGSRKLPASGALKQGRNALRITVANLWIQNIAHEPRPERQRVSETYGARWGEPEVSGAPELPPSGLLGPVRLVATKHVSMQIV
ncbi:MAG: glycosyl hydrolase [Bryobacteraceae bacterium]